MYIRQTAAIPAYDNRRKRIHVEWGTLLIYVVMLSLLMICMIPLIWVIRTAFIPKELALDLTAVAAPVLDNFKRVMAAAPFDKYYGNTIFIVLGVLLVQFVLITLAGYAFARIDFYGSKALFVLFLSQMMIAPEVLILPNYSMIAKWGLTDTRIGIMLPFFASAMGTMIVRQTIKTIPYELEEAAKADGANLFQILWKIYVPLLKPAYISFGMISASFQWNNFLWPLVMTDSVEKRPLSLGLAMFAMSYETGAQWSDVSAATVLVCAPLLLLFFVFQRQFMESFMHSGIK
ncbi:MAG: carbohydrate ABC transporter permease [Lachnospiraceae bacterium]|nr:carbohydrate ABC transporter permease [Lachnospiraceae bacterium]